MDSDISVTTQKKLQETEGDIFEILVHINENSNKNNNNNNIKNKAV